MTALVSAWPYARHDNHAPRRGKFGVHFHHFLENGVALNVTGSEKFSPEGITSIGGIGNGCDRSTSAIAAWSSAGKPLLFTIFVDNKWPRESIANPTSTTPERLFVGKCLLRRKRATSWLP